MNRKVTIIILTWNGLEYTRRCLETLQANTHHPNFELLVVDNGSDSDTLEYLDSVSGIRVIANGKNLGFVGGNNQGIDCSDPDSDIVLLNNDTEVHQPEWLTELQDAAYRSPKVGIVGCRLRRRDGFLQHAGTFMPLSTFWGQQIGGGEKDVNQFNEDREVEGIVFACAYIKRELLNKIGALDTDYFSYFEDTDYCLKAREAGYKVICSGSVTIDHHENVSTRVNNVEHETLFNASQEIFKQKWKRRLEYNKYEKTLAWHSIANLPTGYGISSKQFLLALDRSGIDCCYRYVYGPGTVFPIQEPENSNSYVVNEIQNRKWDEQRTQVVYAQGDVFKYNSGRYKVGFTMLETDHIPQEWASQANAMDEVWVPSSFNEETFRRSGVTKPIHVIPLGVDPDYFNPGITGYRNSTVFTFLSVFEWGERKAPEILLKAFNDEFHTCEPVVLICKTFNSDPGVDVRQQIADLNLKADGGMIAYSLNEIIPMSQLGALYRSAECFVLPTRGEGWGMPILEAMACGLPVIATDWSAQCDFMNAGNAYPLQVEGMVPAVAKCPYYRGFQWAQPSYDHLRSLLRHVFEHPEEARERGSKASKQVRERWTWDHSAQRIRDRLNQIEG